MRPIIQTSISLKNHEAINMRYQLIRLILRLLAFLPLPANHALGTMIGLCLYWLPTKVKHIARINLSLCLPDMSEQQRKTLLRQSLIEMGKSFTELGPLWLWKPEKLMRHIKGVENEACLLEALAKQQGLIILTPHLGCWELTSLHYASSRTVTCLYRPPKIQELEAVLNQARQRTGANLVPTNTTGVKALFAALSRKEAVGILPDQDAGNGGVFVPFFGVSANTVKLIPRLINKTHAQVLMVYARRLTRGRGYVIHFLKPEDDIYSSDLEVSASAMNRAVETCIRENISQYQWGYKRFKRRQEGETSYYDV